MGAENNRMLVGKALYKLADIKYLFWVKSNRGLVENYYLRKSQYRLCQSDSLPVTL